MTSIIKKIEKKVFQLPNILVLYNKKLIEQYQIYFYW